MSYSFSVLYVKDPASPIVLDELRAQFARAEEAGDGCQAARAGARSAHAALGVREED